MEERTATLVLRKDEKTQKFYRTTETESHVVLVEEPSSQYIGHVAPSCGDADVVAESIVSHCEGNAIDLSSLTVLGCDGTVTNTGKDNGIMANIEKLVGKALQRIVCLLHCNELPLRHLIQDVDGKSSGPRTYGGEIGRAIET